MFFYINISYIILITMDITKEITNAISNKIKRKLTTIEENLIEKLSKKNRKISSKLKNKFLTLKYIFDAIYDEFIQISNISNNINDKIINKIDNNVKKNDEIPNEQYDFKKFIYKEIRYDNNINTNINTNIKNININKIVNQSKIELLLNPSIKYKKEYMILDTRYRSIDNANNIIGINNFQWKYSDSNNRASGTINSKRTIKNLICMKFYQFLFPIFLTPNSRTLSGDINRFSLLINEFEAQAFIAGESYRYHLLFGTRDVAIILNNGINTIATQSMVEDFNKGTINFDPISTFETLTITFGNLDSIINFPYDRANVTFTYGNPTTLTTIDVNNLSSNYKVFITTFNTSSINDKNIIDAMNNPLGLVSTVVDSYNFTVPVDTSSIVGPIIGLSVECYFSQWRIILPIEFTYIDD